MIRNEATQTKVTRYCIVPLCIRLTGGADTDTPEDAPRHVTDEPCKSIHVVRSII